MFCITSARQTLIDAQTTPFYHIINRSVRRAYRCGEDGCNLEGRFKFQALLDEQALLACMMYVDLNPIGEGIAYSVQTSDFTSIQERITKLKNIDCRSKQTYNKIVVPVEEFRTPLFEFDGS